MCSFYYSGFHMTRLLMIYDDEDIVSEEGYCED